VEWVVRPEMPDDSLHQESRGCALTAQTAGRVDGGNDAVVGGLSGGQHGHERQLNASRDGHITLIGGAYAVCSGAETLDTLFAARPALPITARLRVRRSFELSLVMELDRLAVEKRRRQLNGHQEVADTRIRN
jgi:hypothetical protein